MSSPCPTLARKIASLDLHRWEKVNKVGPPPVVEIHAFIFIDAHTGRYLESAAFSGGSAR
jgi:hypothetical protein